MADSYPPSTVVFVDMLTPRNKWDTDIQSTAGRGSGIGKRSVCYFIREAANQLTQYKEGNDTLKEYNSNTRYKGKGRPRKSGMLVLAKGR